MWVVLVSSVWGARADNWPQFRGANAAGVSGEGGLPAEWAADKNIRWKVPIPGVAWSSPIVWGDRVFVTTAASEKEPERPRPGLYFGGERPKPPDASFRWEVICLDAATGKMLWRKTAREGKPNTPVHLKNTYASETPVTDGARVYAYFGSAGLYCYDFAGELLWQKDLGTFKTRFGWGTASSPTIDADRLYVQCDSETDSFLVALDKQTGREVWRVPRDEKSSWSSPFLWQTKPRSELVTCGTNRVRAYDPASGKLLWELAGMSSIVSPTPFAANDLLYVSSGYVMDSKKPLFAIRPGGSGDLSLAGDATSNASIAWCQKQAGPYIPSPLVIGDYVYVLYDMGFFACYHARTGEPVYGKQRLDSRNFTASPWSYGGKIFCLAEDGTAHVLQAGPEFKVLSKNSIPDMFMASPAIANGSLFLRSIGHLYCIREDSESVR
jgi:outer membrane protein assembly factor BamB